MFYVLASHGIAKIENLAKRGKTNFGFTVISRNLVPHYCGTGQLILFSGSIPGVTFSRCLPPFYKEWSGH